MSSSSSPSTVEAAAPSALRNALECRSEIVARLGQQTAFFLDYDGTLTPIVEDPSAAVLDNNAGCRDVLRRLSAVRSVAVVSGRSCDKRGHGGGKENSSVCFMGVPQLAGWLSGPFGKRQNAQTRV